MDAVAMVSDCIEDTKRSADAHLPDGRSWSEVGEACSHVQKVAPDEAHPASDTIVALGESEWPGPT